MNTAGADRLDDLTDSDGEYCSSGEAARLFGVSVKTVQLWSESGRLKSWRTSGGHRRFALADLRELVDSSGGPSELYYSTGDAAKLLGVSSKSIQMWADAGYLSADRTIGGHRRFSITSLEQTMEDRMKNPPCFILVIEDDEALARWYKLVLAPLETAGEQTKVEVMQSGWKAMLRIAREQPDVLITDLRMKPIDGFEIIGAILDEKPLAERTRIIAVTGLSPEDLASGKPLGPGVTIMFKPVSEEDLLSTIARARDELAMNPPSAVPGLAGSDRP